MPIVDLENSVITELLVIGIEPSYLRCYENLFCWRRDGRRRSDVSCVKHIFDKLMTLIELKASICYMNN